MGVIDLIERDIEKVEEIDDLTWGKWLGFGKIFWWGLNVLAKCSVNTRDFSSSTEARKLLLVKRGGMDSRILDNFLCPSTMN